MPNADCTASPAPLKELDAWLAFRRFWSAHVDALNATSTEWLSQHPRKGRQAGRRDLAANVARRNE
jgi:hypothetical protein